MASLGVTNNKRKLNVSNNGNIIIVFMILKSYEICLNIPLGTVDISTVVVFLVMLVVSDSGVDMPERNNKIKMCINLVVCSYWEF